MNKNLLIAAVAFVAVLIGGTALMIGQISRGVEQVAQQPAVTSAALAEVNNPQAGNLQIGDQFPEIALLNEAGEEIALSSFVDGQHYLVVNFHHPDCPCAEACGALINSMIAEGYEDVRYVGIMSSGWSNNRVVEALRQQRESGAIQFPVFRDPQRRAMEILGATRTPEIWLLDKEGRVAYWGAPESTLFPGSPDHRFLLREAVDALRAGKIPEIRTFPPIGCLIEDEV